MDKSNTRIDVDCNKIADYSKRNGISLKSISENLGHSRSFLSDMISRNKESGIASMSMSDYLLFKIAYQEEIKCEVNNDTDVDNKKKSFIESIKDIKISDLNSKDFYKLIYMAIKKATDVNIKEKEND